MNYSLIINNRSNISKTKVKLLQFMMVKLLFTIICCSIIAPGIVFAETVETEISTVEIESQEYIVKRNNVQGNDVLVKVFGTVDPNAVYSSVILEQIAPDGESTIQNVIAAKDGYYEFYIFHNWYSLRGNYDVTLSLDEIEFGTNSYEIIQDPSYKSPEQIKEEYYLQQTAEIDVNTVETEISTVEIESQEYIVKRNNVQGNDVLVKVFGTVDPNAVYSSVILEQIAPDGESTIQNVVISKYGYYEYYIFHNWYSLRGNYDVTLSLDEIEFVTNSYEIIQDPSYKSPEPINQEKYYLKEVDNDENIVEYLDNVLTIPKNIPVWMKVTLDWYYMDLITEEEVIYAIKFLVTNDIIKID